MKGGIFFKFISRVCYLLSGTWRVCSQFKSCYYVNACACALYVLLPLACLWLASKNSKNTHLNENRFLAFGSLISNAEVENAVISDYIIVYIKFKDVRCQ